MVLKIISIVKTVASKEAESRSDRPESPSPDRVASKPCSSRVIAKPIIKDKQLATSPLKKRSNKCDSNHKQLETKKKHTNEVKPNDNNSRKSQKYLAELDSCIIAINNKKLGYQPIVPCTGKVSNNLAQGNTQADFPHAINLEAKILALWSNLSSAAIIESTWRILGNDLPIRKKVPQLLEIGWEREALSLDIKDSRLDSTFERIYLLARLLEKGIG
jgi:hypothetical protein